MFNKYLLSEFMLKKISLKVREWKTIYHANGHQKKAGVEIIITDELDFKSKTIIRDEEGHYIPT